MMKLLKLAGLVILAIVIIGILTSHPSKPQSGSTASPSSTYSSSSIPTSPSTNPSSPSPSVSNPTACNVASLTASPIQALEIPSPDGTKYLVNKNDSNGVKQVYVGETGNSDLTCITCTQEPDGPNPARTKVEPTWYPNSQWIFMAVERDTYSPPPILGSDASYVRGQLENGLWTDMWAVSPDGTKWYRLTNFKSNSPGTGDGYTGPAFTPDGKTAVWSQAMNGDILQYYPFGQWELVKATVSFPDGVPTLSNEKNITPTGMDWNEPGNFSPDGVSLVISGSTNDKDQEGMDQYILNVNSGRLTDITNSPNVWDEHGVFSPDGKKVLFMSSYPYRSQANSDKVLGIKTEFMIMNSDGTGLTQLTHFETSGYPEYSTKGGIAAIGGWTKDGTTLGLLQLFFPNYKYWILKFEGACGNQ